MTEINEEIKLLEDIASMFETAQSIVINRKKKPTQIRLSKESRDKIVEVLRFHCEDLEEYQ